MAAAAVFILLSLPARSAELVTQHFHFRSNSASQQLLNQVGQVAEASVAKHRRDWLAGADLRWPGRANIEIVYGRGSSVTSTIYRPTGPQRITGRWVGNRQTLLYDHVPHEVLHIVFALHFGRPLPRWLDEGAATTVESSTERSRIDNWLMAQLHKSPPNTIPIDRLFALREYPPGQTYQVYAQGHSLVMYLLTLGDRQQLMRFTAAGLAGGDDVAAWQRSLKAHYGFEHLVQCQGRWLDWIRGRLGNRRNPGVRAAPQPVPS